MGKFPLTEAFLRIIEDTAARYGAKRITGIWLTGGKGMVFPRKTAIYLEQILKGTAARGAEIYISHKDSAEKCQNCGWIFTRDEKPCCPGCGGESSSISLEKSFIIERMEIVQ